MHHHAFSRAINRLRRMTVVVPAVVAGLLLAVLVSAGLVLARGPATAPGAKTEPSAVATDTRPNVVVIMTDDMRADELASLPHVRRLIGAAGRRYTQALAPHPLCCPTRAEMMTGQYGQNNGVQDNSGQWGGYQALRDADNTIGAWLSDAGYQTYYTGKYMNGYQWDEGYTREQTPRPRGWTRWDPVMTGYHDYWRYSFWNGDESGGRYVAETVTRRTLRALDDFHRSGDPFVLYVNHLAPHNHSDSVTGAAKNPQYQADHRAAYSYVLGDYTRKPSYNEADVADLPAVMQAPLRSGPWLAKYERKWRDRQRALQSVDASVARIIDRLEATGELDNTYVVFTSDNGWHLGEHRLMSKNTVYAESLRIPLLVRGPGIAPGTVNRTPVTLVDLAPTILGWTGASAGRPSDGLPLHRFDTGRTPARDTILIQVGDVLDDATPGWRFRGVVAESYTYAEVAGDPGSGVLFDHRSDPHEITNLFEDPRYAAIRAELSRRTGILSHCAGASCNQVFGALPEPAAQGSRAARPTLR